MAIKHQQDHYNDTTLHCFEESYNDNNSKNNFDEKEEVATIHDCLYEKKYIDVKEQENPIFLQDQDLVFEDEELETLLAKQEQNQVVMYEKYETNSCLYLARKEAVERIFKVSGHHCFAPLTAVLAVNYLDRVLLCSCCFHLETDHKPWMTQLAAVACLSLAAKIEETRVPLLLDLQVVDSEYLFEAKTVKGMEILVLSTLNWKMKPVIPLSFIDHFTRRLGFKEYCFFREFIDRCEHLILCSVLDLRSMQYAPSVMATATMLQVITTMESNVGVECLDQLFSVFGIEKDKVEQCSRLVKEIAARDRYQRQALMFSSNKRKFTAWSNNNNDVLPRSPDGVIDMSFSCSDNSIDSWSVASSSSSSVSSSPEPQLKKSRAMGDAEPLLEIPR